MKKHGIIIFLTQKCYYENAEEAYDECTKHNQELYEDMLYHYSQMRTCAEELKKFDTIVELPKF